MEVTKPTAALLSNYEVLTLLKNSSSIAPKQNNQNPKQLNIKRNQSLATICFETKQYLEATPCRNQTPEIIASFIKAVEPFKLTKNEKLQLLNLRPTTDVEIPLIIEENESRLSEEDFSNLLQVIGDRLIDDQTEELQELQP